MPSGQYITCLGQYFASWAIFRPEQATFGKNFYSMVAAAFSEGLLGTFLLGTFLLGTFILGTFLFVVTNSWLLGKSNKLV